MAVPVIMPRQGQSVESCIISKWYKKKGDQVKEGDMLFTYETDKATFDEEAKVEGTILEIFFEEEDDVPVLTNVCVIGNPGENYSEFDPREQNTQNAQNTQNTQNEQNTQAVQHEASGDSLNNNIQHDVADALVNVDGKVKISPRARNYAEKIGIDYRYANPTGPNGRIIERDVISLKENGPIFTLAAKDAIKGQNSLNIEGTGIGGRITSFDLARSAQAETQVNAQETQVINTVNQDISARTVEEAVEVKLTNIRKVIAKSMHQSLATTAQLTLNASFDATEVMNYRKKIKENKDKLGLKNITLNDIVLYAVTRTLLNHKSLNAHFLDDRIKLFNIINLGVAVDTERGLMVPTC